MKLSCFEVKSNLVILILSPGFPSTTDMHKSSSFMGGSFIYGEAIALKKAGSEVIVLTPHVPNSSPYEIDAYGIKIIRFRYFFPTKYQAIRLPHQPIYTRNKLFIRLFQFPFFALSMCWSLLRLSSKIDIIYANWTQTALFALPMKYLCNKPIFLTYRGTDLKLFPFSLNRFIIKKSNGVFYWPLGDVTSFQRRVTANYFYLPLISRVKDQSNKRELNPEKIVFLFIGRLVSGYAGEVKGIPLIIPAFRKLLKRNNNIEMHILGDGPKKNDLANLCHELKMEEAVFFHGHRQDIIPFLLQSDAVLGGAGLNAISQESAYCGCLLILPNINELTGKIWRDKENAILYELMNLDSLVEGMQFVIDNREKCNHIARKGNITIKKYVKDIDNAGSYYLKGFQAIIDQKKDQL